MATIFYDKTEKGREEISSRKYQLSSKLRPLLVMIDGKHGSEELLKRLAGIGLNQSAIDELLRSGFIALVEAKPAEIKKEAISSTTHVVSEPSPLAVETTVAAKANEQSPTDKLAAVRQFFTETIKGNLGLRGFTLQLKVERADTLADFIALSEDYIEALYKAKGQQIARNLEARLQQLIEDAR